MTEQKNGGNIMDDYTQITITAPEESSCIVEAALTLNRVSGWMDETANGLRRTTFYVPMDESGRAKAGAVIDALRGHDEISHETGVLKGADWENDWKKNFKPKKIGGIIVTPPWENPVAENGEKIIVIEPGMAFGTGDHATTSLCIELTQKYVQKGFSFLDLGTGSAILSMTAALAGAGRTTGIDNDPVAVAEARKNLERMGLQDRIEILEGDAEKETAGEYDVTAANLFLHQVSNILSSGLPFLKKGGVFIGSGITVDQRPAAEEAVRNSVLEMLEVREEGLWIAFAARKTI